MGRRPFLFENPEKYSRVSKSEYEAGDKSALMRIIVDCALSKSPIPEWAASILEGAENYAYCGEIASWDEVFGKPNSRKRAHVLLRWQRRHKVHSRIIELHHFDGCPINDELFEKVGRELGIGGKTEVKNLYKAAKAEIRAAQRRE
jgi:hypothetical protein